LTDKGPKARPRRLYTQENRGDRKEDLHDGSSFLLKIKGASQNGKLADLRKRKAIFFEKEEIKEKSKGTQRGGLGSSREFSKPAEEC